MTQPSILVVDDDEGIRELFHEILSSEGYQVATVPDGHAALRTLRDTPVNVVVADIRLPDIDGFEVLERASQLDSKIVTIMITGHGTIDDAVRAMKAGAFDYITKPFKSEAALVVIKKALEHQRLLQENHLLRKAVRDHYHLDQLVGNSEAMQSVLRFIEKVADSDSTILIQGETGTGKELVARMLHFNSFRRDRPLVPVNCGAIPETLLESELFGHEKGAFTGAMNARIGRFEMAHGGTIFLDEVAEMPLSVQVKLLRVLQDRSFERVGGNKTITVDVRVVAATNQDLEQEVGAGRFRGDLFYRLNVIPVTMPPLRERVGDIPLLTARFIRQYNQRKHTTLQGFSQEGMNCLLRYSWPGNIRELENLIERLVVLKKTGMIEAGDLPEKFLKTEAAEGGRTSQPATLSHSGINLVKELEQFENHLIMVALHQANGITSKAAQLLHMKRTTLVEKLKRKRMDTKFPGNGIPLQFPG